LVIFGWIDCLSEWSIVVLSLEDGSATNIPVELRILRIAKLTRLLRALKAVKFLDQLRLMLELCMMSLISCFWVLLMIFFIVFVFSLVFSEGVVRHLQDSPQDIEQLACFQGVLVTSLTLLQSTTGGVDWAEPYEIFGLIGRPYQFMFLFYVLFFLLIVLNIVTSVFLDRVMKFAEPTADQLIDERSRMEERDIKFLQQIFADIDLNHDGTIQISEFAALVSSKKFGAFLAARGIDIKEAAAFFELVCDKSRKDIDVIQVVKSCVRMKGYASSVDLQIMRNEIRHQHMDLMDKIEETLGLGCNSGVEPEPGN
jgi:membrane protein implicated in regulation of membrane protease activity